MFRPALLFFVLAHAAAVGQSASPVPPTDPFTLWFTEPGKNYLESCVLGNGRLGAMMLGGVTNERIVLNEQTVWSGGRHDCNQADAADALPEIRQLFLASKAVEGSQVVAKRFRWQGGGYHSDDFGCYQKLGDLLLDFGAASDAASDYRRTLDVVNGIAKCTFTLSGVHHTRELVVSYPDQVIALRLTVDRPGTLSFTATLDRAKETTTTCDGDLVSLSGQLPGTQADHKSKTRTGLRLLALLGAKAEGGTVVARDGELTISGASAATLIISAGTDYAGFNGARNGAFADTVKMRLAAALARPFSDLSKAAAADHRALMDRCQLHLPAGPNSSLPTPKRKAAAAGKTADPALDALYFQFGRHLLISSSRADSPLPSNLQGIWCDEYKPAWECDFHTNINLQMNYWLANPTNLAECNQPLLRFINALPGPGGKTAHAYFKARGWMCYHTQNPWLFTAPANTSCHSTTNGAWLCQHLIRQFDYTGDLTLLRQSYPTLKGAAQFYLDALTPVPGSTELVMIPSSSPENNYRIPGATAKGTTALCVSSTYDNAIIRTQFLQTARAARILGIDEGFAKQLDSTAARLRPITLGTDGRIMEWREPFAEPEPHHRHVSHLWPLYPGDEINAARPDLQAGAKKTLIARSDISTGWSMAWKAMFWARLKDGDHAASLFHHIIQNGAPNLFCLHPPFQIDGNFGGVNAACLFLLQQEGDVVELLPALPAAWPDGKVTGLKAPGDLTVNITWKAGKVTTYQITAPTARSVKVRVNGELKTVTAKPAA